MDKPTLAIGFLLFVAGLVGVSYGVGINLRGMMARGAADYSGIIAYIMEWSLIMLAGILLLANGSRHK